MRGPRWARSQVSDQDETKAARLAALYLYRDRLHLAPKVDIAAALGVSRWTIDRDLAGLERVAGYCDRLCNLLDATTQTEGEMMVKPVQSTMTTHWQDILGNVPTADAWAAWLETRGEGETLAAWLERQSAELWTATGEHRAEDWDALAGGLLSNVAAAIRGMVGPEQPGTTYIDDWLAEGDFDAGDTIESLAAAWERLEMEL